MRIFKIMLAAVLFAGSPCFALERAFTYSCPDDIADEVRHAVDCWSVAVDGVLQGTRVSRNADIVVTEVKKIRSGYRGWTDTENGHISILIVVDCNHRDSVVLHEFGHAFGLGHSKDRGSIMYRSAKDEATLSSEDQAKIRRKYGLTRHKK